MGETSTEIGHDGEHSHNYYAHQAHGDQQKVNERLQADQRGLEQEHAQGGHHANKGELTAENLPPVAREAERRMVWMASVPLETGAG